jgi:hypothetical protein
MRAPPWRRCGPRGARDRRPPNKIFDPKAHALVLLDAETHELIMVLQDLP